MIDSINEKRCTGCGLCVEICPMDVFRLHTEVDIVSPEGRKRPVRKTRACIAYRSDCMTCFSCELKCPAGAIEVGYAPPEKPHII